MKKGVSKSRFLAVLAGFTKEARQGRPPHWLSIWVAHGLTCQRLSADVIFDIKIFLGHNSFFDIKASKIQNDSQQFTEERLETRSRTIIPWPVQSISQSPITRYNDPFFLFDLCLRPWWKHLTSQVSEQRSVFMLSLIFGWPVRLPVGKHPGWADQTPESVPCLDLFVNITCLANMILRMHMLPTEQRYASTDAFAIFLATLVTKNASFPI